MRFTVNSSNWLCCEVPEQVQTHAVPPPYPQDSLGGSMAFESETGNQAVGAVAEYCLNEWLSQQPELQYEWVQRGDGPRRSFTVAGISVSVMPGKFGALAASASTVQVVLPYNTGCAEQFFVVSYERTKRTACLLGGIVRDEFFEDAEYCVQGDRSPSNYIYEPGDEIYSIAVRQLRPPVEWLRSLRQPR